MGKKGDVTKIPISKLRPSEHNRYEMVDIEELAGSIRAMGLIDPIAVCEPDENGMYEIISGERRYRALNMILEESGGSADTSYLPNVPCNIIFEQDVDVLEKKLAIEEANLQVRDIDKNEGIFTAIGILKEMVARGDLKERDLVKEAQKYMSISPRYIRHYRQIFDDAIPELKDLVGNKDMTIEQASRIAGMDEERQKDFVEKFNTDGKKAAIEAFLPKGSSSGSRGSYTSSEVDELLDQYASGAENDGYDDIDTDDLMGLLNDSMGSTGGSGSSTGGKSNEDVCSMVINWATKMMNKESDSYTEEEEAAIDACRELIEYIGY